MPAPMGPKTAASTTAPPAFVPACTEIFHTRLTASSNSASNRGHQLARPPTALSPIDAADLGQQPLRRVAVTGVTRAAADRIASHNPVLGELVAPRPLEHRPGHLAQQPVRAQQLRALGLRATQQLVGELLVNQRRITVRPAACRHHFSVGHRMIPSEFHGLRVGSRSPTQRN